MKTILMLKRSQICMECSGRSSEEARLGLDDIGRALRSLHGSQMTLYRFAQLALPEELGSDDFADMISGNRAVLSWPEIFNEMIHPDGVDKPPVTKDAVRANGLVRTGPNGPSIPVAAEMRLRCERLRTALNAAVVSRASSGMPPRHQEIDTMLSEIVWRAKALAVDLE